MRKIGLTFEFNYPSGRFYPAEENSHRFGVGVEKWQKVKQAEKRRKSELFLLQSRRVLREQLQVEYGIARDLAVPVLSLCNGFGARPPLVFTLFIVELSKYIL